MKFWRRKKKRRPITVTVPKIMNRPGGAGIYVRKPPR